MRKDNLNGHLIVIGSIISLMRKISKRLDNADFNLLRQRGALVQQKTRCENLRLGFFTADEATDDLRRRLKEQGIHLFSLADLFAPGKFSVLA